MNQGSSGNTLSNVAVSLSTDIMRNWRFLMISLYKISFERFLLENCLTENAGRFYGCLEFQAIY